MSLADQPAFARPTVKVDGVVLFGSDGMTYRQWLVGMALQSLLGGRMLTHDMTLIGDTVFIDGSLNNVDKRLEAIGKLAALAADAAIRAQEKK